MDAPRKNDFDQPIGPAMPSWQPRSKPSPDTLVGKHCTLEPLNPERHTSDLWEAFSAGDAREWTYLFAEYPASEQGLLDLHLTSSKRADLVPYVVISGKTGKAVGTMSFMNFNLQNGDIEIGSINLSHQLKKTCMSTEAIFLMISRAIDGLGYRRVVWKCDSLNAASRQAALRYGFTFEGIHRQHMVIKGRSRDTAWFSVIDSEWPERRSAFASWLDPANFDQNGDQVKRLSDLMPPSVSPF